MHGLLVPSWCVGQALHFTGEKNLLATLCANVRNTSKVCCAISVPTELQTGGLFYILSPGSATCCGVHCT